MKFDTLDEYRNWVGSQHWYQTMNLSGGIVTPGTVRTDRRESLLANVDVSEKRVLDIGCNSGQYCFWAKRNGAKEVVGIDVSEKRLDQAKTIAGYEQLEVEFHRLSLFDAPRLGQFDVVFCFAVLTEISDFLGGIEVLKHVIGHQAVLELDLAKPMLVVPGWRAFRQRRGWSELRQNKTGGWFISPTLRTVRKIFGSEYKVERESGGVRYDVLYIHRIRG